MESTPPSHKTIWAMFDAGYNTLEIAKRFGCKEYQIYNTMGRTTNPRKIEDVYTTDRA